VPSRGHLQRQCEIRRTDTPGGDEDAATLNRSGGRDGRLPPPDCLSAIWIAVPFTRPAVLSFLTFDVPFRQRFIVSHPCQNRKLRLG
jgi:hypothetical protein